MRWCFLFSSQEKLAAEKRASEIKRRMGDTDNVSKITTVKHGILTWKPCIIVALYMLNLTQPFDFLLRLQCLLCRVNSVLCLLQSLSLMLG